MILQFPIGDLRGTAGWESLITEAPFGPLGANGFSDRLAMEFGAALTADLVAPYDGYLRRLVATDDDPADPLPLEIQPRVAGRSIPLAAGLSGQMPRVRWTGLDTAALAPEVDERIEDQVTATDPGLSGARRDRFLAGEYSIFIARGETIAAAVGRAEIMLLTADGVALDPLAYFEHYLALPGGADDPLADRDWLLELTAVLTRRTLVQCVDEHGAPLNSVEARAPGASGPTTLNLAATRGWLAAAEFPAGGAPIVQVESVEFAEPTVAAAEQTAARYVLSAKWPAGELQPLGPIVIPASSRPASHRYSTTSLRNWLASQYVRDIPSVTELARYSFGNRVEALVDGIAMFQRLHGDIRALQAADGDRYFYLSGWSMTPKVQLVKDDEDSGFQALLKALVDDGVATRVLLWDELHQDSEQLRETLQVALAVVYLLLTIGAAAVPPAALVAFILLSAAFAGIGALESDALLDFIVSTIESNDDAVESLSGDGINAFLDGRVRETRTAGATRLYDFVGAHHQKLAVMSSNQGAIAYCGGIDIHENRVDDPDHFKRGPYHDLQARVEGPAAAEITTTFRQRWDEQHPADLAADGAPIMEGTGSQVVQVARTFPNKLNPANDSYAFAPNGDFTIRDTTLAAISQAKRYIYIEDQYLTPPPDLEDRLIERLTVEEGLRLIMVIPRGADQPENSQKRALFIGRALTAAPERVHVLFPTRRKFVHDAERHGPVQTRLAAGIDDSDLEIPVDDVTPFSDKGIVLIEDEEIRYTSRDLVTKKLIVGDKGWRSFNNSQAVPHLEKALVREVVYRDIFVHPKCWIIDDVFASVGSANVNMRGMTHDSECNLAVIDGRLDRGGRQFAKQLRIALWLDHLGLHESAAARLLLDDPEHAIEFLITHPGPAGNRLRRYWHVWNSDLKTESWSGLLDPGAYWDAISVMTEEVWETYVDPDGSQPF